MREEWWESPTCFFCNYWWIFLCFLILLLTLFFSRGAWLPVILPPTPTPVPTLTPTPIPTITPTVTPVLGTGDVQITLLWQNLNDLDLIVTDPNGFAISYSNRNSPGGGELDVDSNAGCGNHISSSPVENIFWPVGGAPSGQYKVEVTYYQPCPASHQATTDYTVRVKLGSQVSEYTGTLLQKDDRKLVTTFSR
ncbi:MAG: hypothetical protein WCI88_01705 [Chloroflexota bacterium]